MVQVVVFGHADADQRRWSCAWRRHYGAELKARPEPMRRTRCSSYVGEEKDPLEQYVALALVAVALAKRGGAGGDQRGRAHLVPGPAVGARRDEDLLDLLKTLPLTSLYVGLVKLGVPGWRACG